MNDAHRKARLKHLIATDYGRPSDFVRETGVSKGRVSQMTGTKEPFGEGAARKLAIELDLHEDWFNHNWPTPKEAARGVPYDDAPTAHHTKRLSALAPMKSRMRQKASQTWS